MRKAFEDYIRSCQYDEYIKPLHKTAQQNKKYISFNKAVKLLKVSRNRLNLMIVDGWLNAIVRPLGKTSRTLIELSRINEIRAQLDQLLFKVQAKALLNINNKYIPELLEHDLLKLYYHPADLSNPYRYNIKEIQDLLRKIKRKVSERSPLRQHKKISLTITLERLRNCGVGLGQLLKMVLDGDICPCAMKKGCGLGGLFFYESDIVNFLKELIKKTVDGAVRVDEAARLLGLQNTHIHFLISKGLLKTKKVAISKRRLLFVTTRSIDNFSSMYVLPSKLASSLQTVSVHLIRLLAAEGIQPISGPRIDGGKYCVFRKSDLDETDLRELIDKERRYHQAMRKRRLVNLDQASKILGISKDSIQEYVENGILKQYTYLSSSNCFKTGLYFSECSIKNLKKQATNYGGLISATVAAKMLNKHIKNFFIRYVNTGRLKAMLTGGNLVSTSFAAKTWKQWSS